MRTCISHKEILRKFPCTIRAPRSTRTPTNGDTIVKGGARKLRLFLAENLVDSISHHGDTATLKEIVFRVPGFEPHTSLTL